MAITYPALQLAMLDLEIMNTDRQWAALQVNIVPNETIIKLSYGAIHTNGDREQAIATRHYFVDSKGEASYITLAHP